MFITRDSVFRGEEVEFKVKPGKLEMPAMVLLSGNLATSRAHSTVQGIDEIDLSERRGRRSR